ncbi:hypothetical protein ACFOEE_04460 [Pseudoalteromonas fenneropenaei]|uniref:Helix-turn-helix domain-containing protein n=1 Tax=Pseudoalteromonas fenneropenaei TaxID=1737459 RepID=A0ABV7CGQ9_9GAMM
MSEEKLNLVQAAVALVLHANWLPSEAADRCRLPKRVVYRAVREAQHKPCDKRIKLQAAKEKLLSSLQQIDMELAEL